jgi:D-glycero-D-manno-heptose 1,7-bisphosphate phosphatase
MIIDYGTHWCFLADNRKGKPTMTTPTLPYACIIFDLDSTLTCTISGNTFRTLTDERSAEADWQWIPGRLERLKALSDQGIKIAVATNQGGVAFEHLTEEAMQAELTRMADEGELDAWRVCYTHPYAKLDAYRAEDGRRKPEAGMLTEIIEELDVTYDSTLMVGDRNEDFGAAAAAGVSFLWTEEFFSTKSDAQAPLVPGLRDDDEEEHIPLG